MFDLFYTERAPLDRRPTVNAQNFKDQDIKEGSSLELTAGVDGYPLPKVEWFKDSVSLKSSKSVLISSDKTSHKLKISKIRSEDAGEYKLVATNKVASASFSADINVKTKGNKPKFTKGLADIKVNDLEAALFEVEVDHADSVAWFLDDQAISDHEDFEFKQRGNHFSYKINSVTPEDSGKYECRATNKVGTSISSCQLQVIADEADGKKDGQPTITVDIPDDGVVECQEGEPFELNFDVAGEPTPEVFFYKGDDPIEDCDGRAVITRMGRTYRFFIPDLNKSDAGVYVIEAESGGSGLVVDKEFEIKVTGIYF